MSETIELQVPGIRKRLRVRTAAGWPSRTLAMLDPRELRDPCGLWVKPCRTVHTFGLRHAVDVIFLRADGVVTKVVSRMKPWRLTRCAEARTVLELRAGLAHRLNIAPGVALDLLA
ncbi:MAG TPA: DUF192 domain-containing protein [Burkholderiaceae bacterium]